MSREEFDRLFSALAGLEDEDFKDTVLHALDNGSDIIHADFIQERISHLYPQLQTKIQLASSHPVIEPADTSKKQLQIWWKITAAAAVILVFLFVGLYFFPDRSFQNPPTAVLIPEQILPGSSRATLTLSDGRSIDLSAEKSRIVIKDGIRYADGSSVISQHADRSMIEQVRLTTPKGGQYQITLSDGTQVWLNAASTLTYPTGFSDNTREVMLEGEAYFEVANDSDKPFIVNTTRQRTEVLGTSFNINSYSNEVVTKTTLLTGSVRVNTVANNQTSGQSRILTPNQQSLIGDNGNEIAVHQVNPQSAIAWKNGLFNFHGLSIDESLKQIERWYDIQIIYKGKKPEGYLGGKMSRGVKLSTFLSFLEKDFHIKSELKTDRTLFLYTSKNTLN